MALVPQPMGIHTATFQWTPLAKKVTHGGRFEILCKSRGDYPNKLNIKKIAFVRVESEITGAVTVT